MGPRGPRDGPPPHRHRAPHRASEEPVTALIVSVILLVANGVFVTAEFSISAASRARLEQLAGEGDGRARVAVTLTRELSLLLSAAQLGITVASLLLGAIAEPAIAHLLEDPLHAAGLPDGSAHTVA